MNKLICVVRVSTRKQFNNGHSIQDQINQIEEYASEMGLVIVETIKIEQSGKRQLINVGQLADAIKQAKEIGADIAVTKVDRLSRDQISLLALRKAGSESGVQIHVTSLRRKFSEISDMEFSMMAIMAEQERKAIVERTRRACKNRIGPIGKSISVKTMNAKSAAKRRELAKAWAESISLRNKVLHAVSELKHPNLKNVARWLNGEKVLTRRGSHWTGTNLSQQIQRLGWEWSELSKT
jgi:DNA invertase Pin-like site-specific DNA recombinase